MSGMIKVGSKLYNAQRLIQLYPMKQTQAHFPYAYTYWTLDDLRYQYIHCNQEKDPEKPWDLEFAQVHTFYESHNLPLNPEAEERMKSRPERKASVAGPPEEKKVTSETFREEMIRRNKNLDFGWV